MLALALPILTTCAQASEPPTSEQIPTSLAAPVVQPVSLEKAMTPGSEEDLVALGARLYAEYCAPCHQINGEGNLRLFPSLNGNALVTGQPPTAVIRTVLYGRQEMPGFVDALSAQQLAAVISYIRNAWDNDAPVVDQEQVQREKENGDVTEE